jgi:hypothetical protein
MEIKVQYKTPEEKQKVLDQHKDMTLIEDQILIDGRFLIFSDIPRPVPEVFVTVPKAYIDSLKEQLSQTNLDMQDLMNYLAETGVIQ